MYEYTNTQQYMKTKMHLKYVYMNYFMQQASVSISYIHSKEKNILMF